MKQILGLDLGTNSIGWALIKTDNSDYEINDIGIWECPESTIRQINPKHIRAREKLYRISKSEWILLSMIISFVVMAGINFKNWQFWIGLEVASILTLLSKDK